MCWKWLGSMNIIVNWVENGMHKYKQHRQTQPIEGCNFSTDCQKKTSDRLKKESERKVLQLSWNCNRDTVDATVISSGLFGKDCTESVERMCAWSEFTRIRWKALAPTNFCVYGTPSIHKLNGISMQRWCYCAKKIILNPISVVVRCSYAVWIFRKGRN